MKITAGIRVRNGEVWADECIARLTEALVGGSGRGGTP